MDVSLLGTIGLFLGSALVVGVAGIYLVTSGDKLAEQRGWSHIWVGSTLLAFGTSLPELVTNIASVSINAPGLAIGGIFGANMANVLILAALAAAYGTRRFFAALSAQPRFLTALALALVAVALIMGAGSWGIGVWRIGLGSVLIGGLYIGGMGYLGRRRAVLSEPASDAAQSASTANAEWQLWVMFLAAAGGILLAAPFLAFSAERIAELTGLAQGFVGVLLVAWVTTLPETVVSIAALRKGSPELVAGNVFGSAAFNVFVLAVAEPFYAQGFLLDTMESPHFAAGLAALVLLGISLGRMALGEKEPRHGLLLFVVVVAAVYVAGLYATYTLG